MAPDRHQIVAQAAAIARLTRQRLGHILCSVTRFAWISRSPNRIRAPMVPSWHRPRFTRALAVRLPRANGLPQQPVAEVVIRRKGPLIPDALRHNECRALSRPDFHHRLPGVGRTSWAA